MAIRPYWRDPTRFQIDFYPVDSKTRKRTVLPPGITKKTAIEIEKDLCSAKKNNQPRLSVSATVNELFRDYLAYSKNYLAPSTIKDVEMVFNNSISKILGDFRAEDLNRQHMNSYIKIRSKIKYRNRPPKNKTMLREMRYVSAFITWCRENIRGFRNTDFSLPKLKVIKPKPIILTFEEAIKLIVSANQLTRTWLLVITDGILRKSEASNLTWPDIDFERKTIKVIQKGGEENIKPITDITITEINKLSRRTKFVFQSPVKKAPAPLRDLRGSIEAARKKAGIEKRVYPHLLRHSMSTLFLEAGGDLRTLQGILGHSDIKMTEWYTQIMVEQKRKQLNNLGLDRALTKALEEQKNNDN
ncbi:MAG TPA: hypothetical protein ENH40_05235 [Nitrospirae bacterium]|nr:hypothetical protein [Nitrospirota bacterium]